MLAPSYIRIASYMTSKTRLDALRQLAANKGTTWRETRTYGFNDWASSHGEFCQGMNAGNSIWYTHTGEHFRNERDANDVVSLKHDGWYTDVDCNETAIGIIASLSHNRFIAGYRWTSNDERVYFGDAIFSDEEDAAKMADEHARVFADSEREDSQHYSDARDLEAVIEGSIDRLRECLALRNNQKMKYVRDEIAELIETLRANRETLERDYADYL